MTKKETLSVTKETLSVKTFRSKKNTTYMQCENAYNVERFPYCRNTIQDGQEYITRVLKFNDGYVLQRNYCEGCMRAEFSEEEIEKARPTKKTQVKENRIQTLVEDIRRRLKTYDGNDKSGLASIETALNEIIVIANKPN
jgi:hypothetical protein